MADFKEAFDITMGHEGGYVHDPTDAGGETYRGISRRFHPSWIGWAYIDDMKAKDGGIKKGATFNSPRLSGAVEAFYRAQFWDRFQGDKIMNQALANTLFDVSVNMGVHRAVMFLQEALNLLNRNQRIYADIVEDGQLGPATLRALEGFLIQDGDFGPLLKIVSVLRCYHYIQYMKKDPTQEKYARGWLSRVSLA